MPCPPRASRSRAGRGSWSAPGPPPAAPADRPEAWPRPGEDLVHLSGDWRLLQLARGHRWSLDDLATAWFAAGAVRRAAGAAARSRLRHRRRAVAAGVALPGGARSSASRHRRQASPWARRSITRGTAPSRAARSSPATCAPLPAPAGRFDLVTGTPPYLPPGTGTRPARARRDRLPLRGAGSIESYCVAAATTWHQAACSRPATPMSRAPRRPPPRAGLAVTHWRPVVPARRQAAAVRRLRDARRRRDRCPHRRRPWWSATTPNQWTAEFRTVRAAMGMPDRPR